MSSSLIRVAIAVIAQSVEHVIGNDEVGSSNLPNSSIEKDDGFLWNPSSFYYIKSFRVPAVNCRFRVCGEHIGFEKLRKSKK